MTQRVWILAFSCGFSAGLFLGCTPMQRGRDDEPLASQNVKPPPDPPGSPYHTAADGKFGPPAVENAEPVRQTRYAQENSKRESSVRQGLVPEQPREPGRLSPDVVPSALLHAYEPSSAPPDEAVVIALRSLMAKRLPEAIKSLENCDKANQQALLILLPWVARLGESNLDQMKPQEIANSLDQLETLNRDLRPRAALELGKVCFCQSVRGYGIINRLPQDYAFQAGRGGGLGETMILYVEVKNFISQSIGPVYETRLGAKVSMFDAQGKVVWHYMFPTEPNSSVSPRHDYFVFLSFGVPAHLRPGHYTLTLEVSDQTGQFSRQTPPHRIARRELQFDVASDDSAQAPAKPIAVVPSGAEGQ
jgi:hypothetical protein